MTFTDYVCFEKCELKDKEIISALQKAVSDYENGEITEVKYLLADLYHAIDLFERWYSEVSI